MPFMECQERTPLDFGMISSAGAWISTIDGTRFEESRFRNELPRAEGRTPCNIVPHDEVGYTYLQLKTPPRCGSISRELQPRYLSAWRTLHVISEEGVHPSGDECHRCAQPALPWGFAARRQIPLIDLLVANPFVPTNVGKEVKRPAIPIPKQLLGRKVRMGAPSPHLTPYVC